MCLQKEARKRPTVHTLLNSKFFKTKRSVTPLVEELLNLIGNISVDDESTVFNERGVGTLPVNTPSVKSELVPIMSRVRSTMNYVKYLILHSSRVHIIS
jgi:hypothetical protein